MRSALPFLLAAIVGIVVPRTTFAGINVGESIEWILADSDRVIVGKVTSIDFVTDTDDKERQVATVEVTETLKGAKDNRLTFVTDPAWGSNLDEMRDKRVAMLFCLVKNDGKHVDAMRYPLLLRPSHAWLNAVSLDPAQVGSVLTSDFRVLKRPDDVMTYVRQSIRDLEKKPATKSFTLDVPQPTEVFRELYAKSSVRLVVPVDEKLETLGRKWCVAESSHERSQGARMLRFFKSPKNIELLKSMLNDPASGEVSQQRFVLGNDAKRHPELVYRKTVYHVRAAAYSSLRRMGVEVERPVIEILLEGRDEPNREDPLEDDR
jgi:hypothetical protein